MTMFQKATRKASRLRIGLESPSGGGKTWTALKLATELAEHDGGRVALIDSERGSSAKYADGRPFDFDIAVLQDTSPASYVEAIKGAEAAGYPVIVIDSASHEWKGVLAMVDQAASRMQGNTWAGWSRGRPAHDAFVEAVVGAKAHIIATFRSKQETEQVKEGGRTVVRKLGMAPVSSDDIDYEFDVWGSISHGDHTVIVSKTRIDTIPDGSEWPGGNGLIDAYLAWLGDAEYAEPEAPRVTAPEPEPEPRRRPSKAVSRPAGRSGAVPQNQGQPESEAKRKPFWSAPLEQALTRYDMKIDDLEIILHTKPTVGAINAWLNDHVAEGKNVLNLVEEARVEHDLAKAEQSSEDEPVAVGAEDSSDESTDA